MELNNLQQDDLAALLQYGECQIYIAEDLKTVYVHTTHRKHINRCITMFKVETGITYFQGVESIHGHIHKHFREMLARWDSHIDCNALGLRVA